MLSPALLLLAALPEAPAFCGTYVGGADDDIYNEVSRAAMVRTGTTTILTVANDVLGEFEGFALLIPVPEVLDADDLKVLDPGVFDRLGLYSAPRLVSYDCSDFDAETDTDADTDADTDSDTDVDVEGRYIVGEYDVAILSASESSALGEWLRDNGYAVPAQTAPLLDAYIEAGAYFLAARVAPEAGITPGTMLSPLQMRYANPTFSLPIRIGTASSKGEQDLILYTLTEPEDGATGVANYPQIEPVDECMWDEDGRGFSDFYADTFADAYAAAGDGAWAREYAWAGGGCDPCPSPPPDASDLFSLGVAEDRLDTGDFFFTRLHLRYTPEQADEDLVLYHSNLRGPEQLRYIQYNPLLEDRFPLCVGGWADDPGSCVDPGGDSGAGDGGGSGDDGEKAAGCGCAAPGAALTAPWAALALALVRRRRQAPEARG
jgi:uncharacterized protein (TIGR03382 family)